MSSEHKLYAILGLTFFGLPISLLFPAAIVGVTVAIGCIAMAKEPRA